MSAPFREVVMSIEGVKLDVTILMSSTTNPNPPRRFCVRAGSKQALDEIIKAHVLAEIDRRISGGKLEDAEHIFEVPTPPAGGGA
jgi:hypothetical protein